MLTVGELFAGYGGLGLGVSQVIPSRLTGRCRMTRPCICQPTGTIPVHGEVRRMRWCPRCGELWSLSVVWCPECKGHNAVDVRTELADVIVRAVEDD